MTGPPDPESSPAGRAPAAGSGSKPSAAGVSRASLWPHPDRPRPVARRSTLIGLAIAIPSLLLIDGLLTTLAYVSTGSLPIAIGILLFMFVVSGGELALMAYLTRLQQRRRGNRLRRGVELPP